MWWHHKKLWGVWGVMRFFAWSWLGSGKSFSSKQGPRVMSETSRDGNNIICWLKFQVTATLSQRLLLRSKEGEIHIDRKKERDKERERENIINRERQRQRDERERERHTEREGDRERERERERERIVVLARNQLSTTCARVMCKVAGPLKHRIVLS